MNREDAKNKDRKASREDCQRMIREHGPLNSQQVSERLKADGLGITPNAANCRLLELCRLGDLYRTDKDGLWVYAVTPDHKREACISFYEKEKADADLAKWKRLSETIIPTLPERERKILKALKNDINKVA